MEHTSSLWIILPASKISVIVLNTRKTSSQWRWGEIWEEIGLSSERGPAAAGGSIIAGACEGNLEKKSETKMGLLSSVALLYTFSQKSM